MGSGVLVSDGRWYFVTYPVRTYDHREAHVELVDIGPAPARGSIARIEGVRGEGSPHQLRLVCSGGVVPAEPALALLDVAGVRSSTDDAGDPERRELRRPRYREAAQLLLENGEAADGIVAGLVGIARVLLELAAEELGAPSSAEVLRGVVRNLVTGVENPDALAPD